MTDKIIDGIDVSGCKYHNNGWCLLTECCDDIRYMSCNAMQLFDCYYKQLKHKEQECEELKEENKQLKEWQEANKATGICETCTHKTLLENDSLKHRVRELNKLNKKYKQAFDEIEEYCKDQSLKHDYTDGVVLDIVNKAKEE